MTRKVPNLSGEKKSQAAKKSARGRTKLPRARYTQAEMAALFARFRQQRPEPKGELNHTNPYTLVVAVLLSAQATDVGVNKATANLFKLADTPQKMLALGEARVREEIRTIGLYRNKAKNVIAMSQQLIDEFDGVVPTDRDALTRLAGVGRKTANVVVSMAFGQATMAVDTHIFRLANRMGLAPAKTVDAVEDILMRRIPQPYLYHAHHWLILHGRYTCKARTPLCHQCIVADLCKAKEKTCSVPIPVVELPEQDVQHPPGMGIAV